MEQQCIFCGIANGAVPSKTIYEDSRVRVVLDIYPANPAHLLVLTKQHYAIFNQLSKEDAEHLGVISKRISELMFRVLKPEGINFFIANGAVAGQKAPHFILHAIPRFSGDGLSLDIPVSPVDEKELVAFYVNLKPTLKNYFPEVDFESAPAAEEPPEPAPEEKEATSGEPEKAEETKKEAEEEKEEAPAGEKKEEKPGEEAKEKEGKESDEKNREEIDLDRITERLL